MPTYCCQGKCKRVSFSLRSKGSRCYYCHGRLGTRPAKCESKSTVPINTTNKPAGEADFNG